MKATLLTTLLLAFLSIVIVSLQACGATCQGLDVVSETSHGSFAYTTASAGSGPPSTTHGELASGDLEVGDGDLGAGTSAVQISGTFDDSSGNSYSFTLYVTGVVSGATSMLGPDSEACIDGPTDGGTDGTPCTPLEGTVGTSTFATNCETAGACALSIIGGLKATTTLPFGSVSFDLALQHQDVWGSVACPTTDTYTEGTPGS